MQYLIRTWRKEIIRRNKVVELILYSGDTLTIRSVTGYNNTFQLPTISNFQILAFCNCATRLVVRVLKFKKYFGPPLSTENLQLPCQWQRCFGRDISWPTLQTWPNNSQQAPPQKAESFPWPRRVIQQPTTSVCFGQRRTCVFISGFG